MKVPASAMPARQRNKRRRPQIAREEGEAEAGDDAERGRGQIDRARIAPVGPGDEEGHGHDVADVERALDDADLGIAQRPGEPQLRQQRGDGAVARHVERFRKTQNQGQTPGRHRAPHAIRHRNVSVFFIITEQSIQRCRIRAFDGSFNVPVIAAIVRFGALLSLPPNCA